MRAKASKILLFLIVSLAFRAADARPHKAAPKPASRRSVAAASKHTKAHASRGVAKRHGSGRPSRHQPAVTRQREAPPTLAPSPVPAVPQEEVHVRHNRRPHRGTNRSPSPSPEIIPPLNPALTARKRTTESPAEAADQAVGATIAPAPLSSASSLYDRRGRLLVPPAMKGSREILLRQNVMADRDGLKRIQDDDDLERMRGSRMLVAIPSTPGLQTDERLPSNRRYCRPWTAQFLTALAHAYNARFGSALQVNSAVRTVEFQQKLMHRNGNAAPAEGETASPHLTGQAVDLAKHGLSLTEIAWLRGYLLPLMQEGKLDVEEEFQQACFHISVYKSYLPQLAANPAPDTHRDATAALR